jgi:thiosulfate/3-mercaptopyruvate sulfurtransferase
MVHMVFVSLESLFKWVIAGMLLLFSLLICNQVQAIDLPGPLVDTDWLQQNLDQVKVLDVRNDIESFTRKAVLVRKRFTGDLRLSRPGAHIPGAVLVDFLNIRNSRELAGRHVRYMLPEKAEFEALMQSWGINSDDTVVITSMGVSNTDMTLATRLYWQLKYYGFDKVAILDGGVVQWLLEQKPASIEHSNPVPGNWKVAVTRESIIASSEEVVDALEDNNVQLVDTRSLGYYLGILKRPYVRRKGHIPGAKIFPNELLTSSGPAVHFTAPEDIQQLLHELGIDTEADIITYCNSGQFASASWFVFSELLGLDKVKLYDGSMHQWAIEKQPVIKLKLE